MNRCKKTLSEAFWSRVDRADLGCWEWKGVMNKTTGYGQFSHPYLLNTRATQAHRASYIISKGPIPDGYYVCHACGNRRCVKPTHLYAGTPTDNANDPMTMAIRKALPPARGKGEAFGLTTPPQGRPAKKAAK